MRKYIIPLALMAFLYHVAAIAILALQMLEEYESTQKRNGEPQEDLYL